jgi:hypothetical protein
MVQCYSACLSCARPWVQSLAPKEEKQRSVSCSYVEVAFSVEISFRDLFD